MISDFLRCRSCFAQRRNRGVRRCGRCHPATKGLAQIDILRAVACCLGNVTASISRYAQKMRSCDVNRLDLYLALRPSEKSRWKTMQCQDNTLICGLPERRRYRIGGIEVGAGLVGQTARYFGPDDCDEAGGSDHRGRVACRHPT